MDHYTAITPAGTKQIWNDPNNPTMNRFASHQEAEQHYDACQLHNYQLQLKLGELGGMGPPIPTPPSGTFRPEGKEQSFSGGMLHKPVADSGGNGVLVMAPRYCDASNAGLRVSLLDKNGKVLEGSLRFTGCANGGRPNHRWNTTSASRAHLAPLYYTWTFNGQKEWLVVPDPTKRYD